MPSKPSQAVDPVRGREAACSKVRVLGFLPVILSSTRQYSALHPVMNEGDQIPAREILPENITSSPTLNFVTSFPTLSTTPDASHPITRGCSSFALVSPKLDLTL